MTALRRTAKSLASSSSDSPLVRQVRDLLAEHVRSATSSRPSPAELRSWDYSLPALANDLVDAGLGEIEMVIEYQLPLTSKRADVVLAGVDRRTGEDAYLVVELKQWSRAEIYEGNPEIALVDGVPGDGLRLNPLSQVAAYCDYLTDFVTTLEHHPNAVRGVAYRHNAADRDVADLRGAPATADPALFENAPGGVPRLSAGPVRTGIWRACGGSPALEQRPSVEAAYGCGGRGDQEAGAVGRS